MITLYAFFIMKLWSILNQIPGALQERREAPLVNRIRNIVYPQMQI